MSTLLTIALLSLPVQAPQDCQRLTTEPLLSTPNSVSLHFIPTEGAQVRRTFDSKADYELDEVNLTMDGEEPPMDMPEPDLSIAATEHIVVLDTFHAVSEDRPLKLSRDFEELAWTTEYSSSEGEDAEKDDVSDLEDETVHFQWNEDEGEYAASLDEDSELGDADIAHLTQDMDLVSFLPDDDVSADDSWDLPQAAYLALVWPGGMMLSHEEGEDVDEVQLELTLDLLANTEFEGHATLDELIEENGVSLAQISFEMDVSAEGSVDLDLEEGSVTIQRELERTIEGTLLWNIEEGHAQSLEASAETEMTSTTTQSGTDEEGNEHEFQQAQTFSGEGEYKASFEVE